MRAWICLLTTGALLAMSQPGFAQRAGQNQAGRGAQGAGGGGAGGGGAGFGVGGAGDQNLSDPGDVFGIDRGDTIGASAANVQGFSITGGAGGTGGTGRGGAFGGGFGGLGGLGGLFGGAGGFGGMQQQQQQDAKRIRTRLRADIRVPSEPAPQVEARIETRWAQLPSEPRFRNVNIEMRGRTAVLNGEVGSSEDRRMAELLLRLEPGVSKIENELLIASDVSGDASVPPTMIPAPPANEAPAE